MARPKHPIDWEQVKKLCQLHCTQEEVAAFVECCLDTLQNRCKDELGISFSEFYKEKRLAGKVSLRRSQWALATSGNASMNIWLGKQHLGQKDKIETKTDNSDLVKAFADLSFNLPR